MIRIFLIAFLSLSLLKLWSQDVNFYFPGNSLTRPATGQQFSSATKNDVLILLGDNLSPQGLPPEEHPDRNRLEDQLRQKLDAVKNFEGRLFIIPGDHDWANGKKAGWDHVMNQRKFITSNLGDETVFQPVGGCPGPVEIQISNEIVLIIIDTQYLLHPWGKPRKEDGCEVDGTVGALDLLEDAVLRNKDKHLIVAGHHPVYTYGRYGQGPGIHRQHIKNPRYKVIRQGLEDIFDQADHLVYVSGHEASRQYIRKNGIHYVVAGGSGGNVKTGPGLEFADATEGFIRLTYINNGPTSLAITGQNQSVLYDEEIFDRNVQSLQEAIENRPEFSDSLVTLAGNENLALASKAQKFWMGNSYRKEWATPIEVPVFDLEVEHGGLEIVQRGGGGQTKSLRLEADNGQQYVLRSIKKWPHKIVPMTFRKTFAVKIVYDQISASHPYGAIVVPPLAEAAGIFHTNPSLVFIPDDPKFGIYQPEFAGLMALYEERPNDKAAHEPHFGAADEIESTPKLIEELEEDNDHSYDAEFLVRNRMFDMFLGDWDRHEDQWRWAEYQQKGDAKSYKPIPRDRDQAFFKTRGVIPWIIASKWSFPMFQGMDEEMRWTPGFNWQARWLDRSFLNPLEWSDWQRQIDELQAVLTDDVIDESLKDWPKPIYDLSAPRVNRVLKARRDNLDVFGREYYEFLAREVDILGSDKHEYFLVDRLDDDRTRITVHKMEKDGDLEDVIYERTFRSDETREIVIYGFGGEDFFELKGKVKKGPRVRIVSGKGHDTITDESRVGGPGKKTVVYDKTKTNLVAGPETRDRRSENPGIHKYDRKSYEYDKVFPLLDVKFNPDDGVFLGGGFLWNDHGFRKDPYKQKHRISGNYAVETGAFSVRYEGSFIDVFGDWDVMTKANVLQPYGVSNYFGMGNDSDFDFDGEGQASGFDDAIDFYRTRYEFYELELGFSYDFGDYSSFRLGPGFSRFEVEERPGRFISDPGNGLDQTSIYNPFYYGGISLNYQIDTRDESALPSKGTYFFVQLDNFLGLNDNAQHFSRWSSGVSNYFQFNIPMKIVVGNRVGFEKVFGNPEFFNSVRLGMDQLRGYRRSRFTGETGAYHNIDLRLKLFSFTSYLFPGSMGLLGFHDIGRVWLSGENSDNWHRSAGFGIWLAPVDLVAINVNLAFSEEEILPLGSLNFHF